MSGFGNFPLCPRVVTENPSKVFCQQSETVDPPQVDSSLFLLEQEALYHTCFEEQYHDPEYVERVTIDHPDLDVNDTHTASSSSLLKQSFSDSRSISVSTKSVTTSQIKKNKSRENIKIGLNSRISVSIDICIYYYGE